MRHHIIFAIVCCAGCGAAATAAAPQPVGASPVSESRWRRTPPPGPAVIRTDVRPPKVSQTLLRNGMRVVIVEQHRRPIVSIRAIFGQGAAQDPPDGYGAAFFAVSVLSGFYEVDEEDNRIVEADSFARKVFYSGGQVVSNVGPDQSYFGIDGYAKDTSTYLHLLSAAILKPRCGPNAVIARRDAMINALEEIELSDGPVFQLFVDRAAFGAGHPYARPVFGNIESLKKLGLRQVKERQRALLNPRITTLLVVGDVRARPTMTAIRRAFETWPRRKPPSKRRIRPPRVRAQNRTLLIPRTPAASMVVCATRPLSDVKGQDASLKVLAQVLGASLDSRLGTGLRMQAGVSYSFSAEILDRRYARALVACTRVRAKDTARALTVFKTALQSMASTPPTQTELTRAKRQLLATATTRTTTTRGAVAAWLEAIAHGQERPAVDSAIERVTVEQVHELAARILTDDTVGFVLGGSPKAARRAVQAAGLGPLRTARLDL